MLTISRLRKARGFTIVELLIVIVVIAILAAVVIVAYNGVTSRAIDRNIQSDADDLDALETQYGVKNNVGGEAWYSGNGTDSNLNFVPTKGDIIDVVVNSANTDYCIRIYNPNSATYQTLATAYIKESTPGTCASTPPSSQALNASLPPFTNGGVVTTLAGSGSTGHTNGTGTGASFYYPHGVAVDSSGNVYVADTQSYMIRKITSGGVVTTLAGTGSPGSANGTGTSASFYQPEGVAVDSAGNVYVADTVNNMIRKISTGAVVTTLAGQAAYGYTNNTGTAAQFWGPAGVAVDSSGNVYVADQGNNVIRKVTAAGVVTTFAGSATGTAGSANGTGTAASFSGPQAVAVNSSGNVYVADSGNDMIRKITPAGVVTTVAGSTTPGSANGTGTAASFNNPSGIAVDSNGYIYVADFQNNLIRVINPLGVVSTLAGSGAFSFANGTGTAAAFHFPFGIAVDTSGHVYVGDYYNNRIRMIQ